jgi:hypothetical protein
MRFQTANASYPTWVHGSIHAGAFTGAAGYEAQMVFSVADNAGSSPTSQIDVMTLKNTGNVHIPNGGLRVGYDATGYIGIGTDDPYSNLTVDGNILIGTNTDATGVGFNCALFPLTVTNYGGAHQAAGFYDCNTDIGTRYSIYWFRYYASSWTTIGSVSTTHNSTAFNTSSDYRLKENETPISEALDNLNELKPYEFNFKNDQDTVFQGFFAHEAADIVPHAVIGEKDEVDDDNKIVGQQIDHSKMVPLLVAAVQELSDKVDALAA